MVHTVLRSLLLSSAGLSLPQSFLSQFLSLSLTYSLPHVLQQRAFKFHQLDLHNVHWETLPLSLLLSRTPADGDDVSVSTWLRSGGGSVVADLPPHPGYIHINPVAPSSVYFDYHHYIMIFVTNNPQRRHRHHHLPPVSLNPLCSTFD